MNFPKISKQVEIQNAGNITTTHVISNAKTAVIESISKESEINAKSVNSNKHLQAQENFPILENINVTKNAKLLIGERSSVPQLRKIKNSGSAKFLSSMPNLFELETDQQSETEIDAEKLESLMDLNQVDGKLKIKANLPKLKDLSTKQGSEITIENGSDLSALQTINNAGTIRVNNRINNLRSIKNEKTGILHLLNKVWTSKVDNSGQMLIEDEDKTYKESTLNIRGTYTASENGFLELKGQMSCYDMINDGIVYSQTGIKITQPSGVTNFGKHISKQGLTHELTGDVDIATQGLVTYTDDQKNLYQVKSDRAINIKNPLNMNVNLEILAPELKLNNDVTVKGFYSKTNDFYNNARTLSAKESLYIDTDNFTNISGRIQSHGNVHVNAKKSFKNTGGGKLEKNVKENIPFYTLRNAALPLHSDVLRTGVLNLNSVAVIPFQNGTQEQYSFRYLHANNAFRASYQTTNQTIERDVYELNLSKIGLITSGKILNIEIGLFDNSFGALNASESLHINSKAEINNECGLIYSGGPATINGTLLKNGYRRGSQSVNTIDPNRPITTRVKVTGRGEIKQERKEFWSGWMGVEMDVDVWHPLPDVYEEIITGYHTKTVYSTASTFPGYTYSPMEI